MQAVSTIVFTVLGAFIFKLGILAYIEDGSSGSLCFLQLARARLDPRRDSNWESDSQVAKFRARCRLLTAAQLYDSGGNFWSNKNGDSNCSGRSPYSAKVAVDTGPAWSFKDDEANLVSAHPCVDDALNIYLAHRNGMVRKFTSSGKLLWMNQVNFQASRGWEQFQSTGPALMGGSIFTATTDGSVTSIDRSTGETLWRVRVSRSSGVDASSLMARAGLLLVAGRTCGFHQEYGGDNQVIAMDASDGKVLWRWFLPEGKFVYNFLGVIVPDPPSVLFSDSEGTAYRINLCDGRTIWTWPSISQTSGSRVVFSSGGMAVGPNGHAYVTSNIQRRGETVGMLSAYRIADGASAWNQELAMEANAMPSVGTLRTDGRLLVVVGIGTNPFIPGQRPDRADRFGQGLKSEVIAFDAETGQPTGWKYTPPLHMKLEGEGDRLPRHVCLPDAWSAGALAADGTFYVGHMSGNLFAIRDFNGDGVIDESDGEVETYYGGRSYQGSPALAPDLMVATPCDGLHVFPATISSQTSS